MASDVGVPYPDEPEGMTAPMHPDTMLGLMRQRQWERLETAARWRRSRRAKSRNSIQE
jgi:hypothetical protein